MHPSSDAMIRWTTTLLLGVLLILANPIGVYAARSHALEVNGIALTAWWFALALIAPILCVSLTLWVPPSNRIWEREFIANMLIVLVLSSFAYIPVMYVIGGFR